MFKSVVVTLAATTLLFAQSSSTIQFYDSLGVTKTARFGWQGAPTTGKFFIETPSDNAQNVTVDKGELTAKKVSGDGSGLTNVVPKDGSVTGEKIGVGAVDSTKIGVDAVVTAKIKNGAVDSNKIGPGAVVTAKIKDKAVTDAKIDSVSWGKISGKPVIPSGVVGDGSIDSGKIASNAITTNKIKDGAVTDAKVAGVAWTKISGKPSLLIAGSAIDSITARTIVTMGNVGIGAASSVQRLCVVGDGTNYAGKFDANGVYGLVIENVGANYHGLVVSNTTPTDLFSVQNGANGSAANSKAYFSGNVGIGTMSPGAKLEINGADQLRFRLGSGSSDIADIKLQSGDYDLNFIHYSTWGSSTQSKIGFYTNGDVSTPKMVILKSGNVGIGTTDPGSKLVVSSIEGTIQHRFEKNLASLHIRPNKDEQGWLTFTENGVADRWGIGCRPNDTKLYFSYGNVIGLSPNNQSLDKIAFNIDGSICASTINTSCNLSSSDRRFKLSITPLDSSLSKITRLQGVYYLWDTKKFPERNFDTTKQIGLIAQDVEKIIPEVVHTAKDGYKSLSYDKLTAVLIEAVKEQQKQIELQQKQINDLRAEIKNSKK